LVTDNADDNVAIFFNEVNRTEVGWTKLLTERRLGPKQRKTSNNWWRDGLEENDVDMSKLSSDI
jgi:hypothetical protein